MKLGMPQLLLVPGNPRDLTPQKLADLVSDLSTDYSADVGVVEQRGYGVTWWEVLLIYIGTKGVDAIVGRAFDEALDRVEASVRRWVSGRRQAEDTTRPFFFAIYDEDGELVKAIELPRDDEANDVTERERAKGKRPPPQAVEEEGPEDPAL